MGDPCESCDSRGKINQCRAQQCVIHESWVFQALLGAYDAVSNALTEGLTNNIKLRDKIKTANNSIIFLQKRCGERYDAIKSLETERNEAQAHAYRLQKKLKEIA